MDPNGYNVDYRKEDHSLNGYPSVSLAQAMNPQNLDYVDDEIFNDLFPQKAAEQLEQSYNNSEANPFSGSSTHSEHVDLIKSNLLINRQNAATSSQNRSGSMEMDQSRANSIKSHMMYLLQDPPSVSSNHLYPNHGSQSTLRPTAVKTEPTEGLDLSPDQAYHQSSSSGVTTLRDTTLRDIVSQSTTNVDSMSHHVDSEYDKSNDTQSNHSFKSESETDKLVSEIIKSEPIDVEEFTQKRSKRGRKRKTTDSENELRANYDKESNEYKKKRLRNNIAVRKSRDKAKQRQVEQQNRLVAMAKECNSQRQLITHLKDECEKKDTDLKQRDQMLHSQSQELNRLKRFISSLPIEHQPEGLL